MEYIIQMRVTRTYDKHVCKVCGKDAYLCGVGYEATSQEMADQFSDELQRAQTWEQLCDLPTTSKVSDAVFDATVEEQRVRGPQEHDRFYECADCFSSFLSDVTGDDCGREMVAWLISRPLTHALFCVRNVALPDQCLIAAAKAHDPLLVLAALKDSSTPRLRMS